jgi:hypothetical protein
VTPTPAQSRDDGKLAPHTGVLNATTGSIRATSGAAIAQDGHRHISPSSFFPSATDTPAADACFHLR